MAVQEEKRRGAGRRSLNNLHALNGIGRINVAN